jgi:hypothetical protein
MRIALCGAISSAGSISCRGEAATPPNGKELIMNTETTSAIKAIAGVRIFWGHQSVGGNVLEGLKGLLTESQTAWPIVEMGSAPLPNGPALLHQRIGENGNPKGKMDAFARSIRELAEPKPKLAFMKLCYVDVNRDTDVDKLIEYYSKIVTQLKSEHPSVVFAHATVPLAPEASGIKDRLKHWVGVELKKERDNLRRVRYNALLRKTFPDDPLFDLERIESTRQDGTRVQFQLDGQTAYALAKEYSGDGSGHLNVFGKKLAAMGLVGFLAAAVSR